MTLVDLIRYARVHRGAAVLAGAVVVALLSAFFGGTRIPIPSFGSGDVTMGIPYRQELPLLSAVFLTAALDGPMAAHEALGTRAMHRLRAVYCTVLTLTVCAFSFTAETYAVGTGAGIVFVRSVLVWLGLALLSRRVLGHQLAWALPLASALLLIWYPLTWWDWTATPTHDTPAWTAAGVSVVIGSAATAATPWRRKALRRSR
ncbi:hypothetical protein [Kitasatospora terrestris]|uniref:DUF998 domain-containing protein n=1 Tax=Kitasatospora terrestris TaxID=258051 RepID=A0ABP9ERT3_9ACTN